MIYYYFAINIYNFLIYSGLGNKSYVREKTFKVGKNTILFKDLIIILFSWTFITH